MAAPNHVNHQAAAAGASSSASPKAGSHDPSVSPDRDPTQHLVEMLACTALATPNAATNQVDQPQAVAAVAAEVGASVSSATADHCPGVVAPDDDDPTVTLTESFATTTLETAAAVANKATAPSVSDSAPIRASESMPPAAKPAGDRAERKARRRTRLRLVRVPADYLRAEQDSRDRRRRRDLVRRCVGRLFCVHKDRASERGISAMMARLTTTMLESASDAIVSAAAPSPEHAALADLLEKMALSKKH